MLRTIVIFFSLFIFITSTCRLDTDCKSNEFCNCHMQCVFGKVNTPTLLTGYFYYTDGFHPKIFINYNYPSVYLSSPDVATTSEYIDNVISADGIGLWAKNHSNGQLILSKYEVTYFKIIFDNNLNGYCIYDVIGMRLYRPNKLDLSNLEQNKLYFLNESTTTQTMLFIQTQQA